MTYRYVADRSLQIAQIALLATAVVRGANYLVTPPGSSFTLWSIEDSAPLWVWGYTFIGFGMLGLLGEAWMGHGKWADGGGRHARTPSWVAQRRWIPSNIAHVGLILLYLAVAVSAAIGLFAREPFYGFVAPVELTGFALAHWVFASRRKDA